MNVSHIGVLFEFPTLNGGEHSMLAILSHMTEARFQFTAFAPPHGPLFAELRKLSIPTIPFCVRGANDRKRPTDELHNDLRALISGQQLDLLHSNSLSMSRLVGQLDFGDVRKSVRTGHLRDIIKLNRTTIANINQNNGLIAVSEATRGFHVSQGLDGERCRVIHNGVDSDIFRPAPNANLRETIFPNIPPSAKILLNVGQICLRKNQLNLARAVCRLLQSRDDIYLVLAGVRHSVKQESIEYELAIEDEFRTAGKSQHLKMMGFRKDVPDLMNSANLLVHMAHQEPFGRTLLEAAASELPIIASKVGGTSEMLRDNIDAMLIDPVNVENLGNTITQVLHNSEVARERSQSARQRIATRFSVEQAAQGTLQFWRDQLDGVSDAV